MTVIPSEAWRSRMPALSLSKGSAFVLSVFTIKRKYIAISREITMRLDASNIMDML
jgi:hypothetical protein